MALQFPRAYYEQPKPYFSTEETVVDPERTIPDQQFFSEPEVETEDTKPFDAESNPEVVSKLDISWLPFAAKTYHISPNIEDYVLYNIPLCPSDLPNRNGVAFPIEELVKFHPPPMNDVVYRSWRGCPVHLEHDNEDPTKAYGVIFDTSLRKIKNFGNGKHWSVQGLIGIDKVKHPDMAEKVLKREINTGSMGAMADYFTCSVCGHECSDKKFMNCAHITSTQHVNWKIIDHEGQKKVAYLNAHGLSPIEYSLVESPAWCTSYSDELIRW